MDFKISSKTSKWILDVSSSCFAFVTIAVVGCTHSPTKKISSHREKVNTSIKIINDAEKASYIQGKVLSKVSDLRDCLHPKTRDENPLITFKFQVLKGSVTSVSFLESKLTMTEESCLTDVVTGLRLPLLRDSIIIQPMKLFPKPI